MMKGVIAAVPTPVDTSGAPLRDPFLAHCHWALANGCDGLNILGTTGEANSLDVASRRQVMEWAAEALERQRLMVGTGTPSLAETTHLTAYADDLGYPVALILPPYYYKPASDEALFAWFMALHNALGDRQIAVYFYNFPQMTGLTLSLALIQRLVAAAPERFRGIKDSSGDLAYCRAIAAALPGFVVLPSSETALSEEATSGFAGCISATANLSAPLCQRSWQGEQTEDLHRDIAHIRTTVANQSLIPGIKYLVGKRLNDARIAAVLPPLLPLSDSQIGVLDGLALPGL